MHSRIVLLLLLMAGWAQSAFAQNLFLPTSLNTAQQDIPTAFLEHKGSYYFAGTQWPLYGGEASSGFCYQTDASGNVLHTLRLAGVDSLRGYRFEAIYAFQDELFILAATASYDENAVSWSGPAFIGTSYEGYDYNKLLLIRLNKNLQVRGVDTLLYDTDTSDLLALKTVFMDGKIYAAYSGLRSPDMNPQNLYHPRAFLTVYDLATGAKRHQPIDSAFLAPVSATYGMVWGNSNEVLSLTRTGDKQLLFGCNVVPYSGFEGRQLMLQMDTSLTVTYLPFYGSYTFQPAGLDISQETYQYTELWKPTATSSYFLGPLFFSSDTSLFATRSPMAIGRLQQAGNRIVVSASVPKHPSRAETYLSASNHAMTLLGDQKHFVMACRAFGDFTSGFDSARIRIAKYDTSLNLIWNRDFGRPYGSYRVAGMHELSSNKLMVIASLEDRIAGGTADLHCFILEPDGTPLRTFTVPTTAWNSVKVYPNPAQSEIRFELPTGQSTATYTLTDLAGRTVAAGTLLSGNAVPVSALPSASYLFRIQTPDQKVYSGLFTKE